MLACRKRNYRAGSRSNAEQRYCVIDATQAEYDRFGGVGIPMAGQPKSPARLFYLSIPPRSCYGPPMFCVVTPVASVLPEQPLEFGLGAVAVLVGWGVVRSGIHVQ